MRATAASSGWDGVVATDRWGAHWRVSCHRAGVLPAPAVPPDDQALHRLLLPWETAAAAAPPPPRASWVLGRSARWQGPRAPGASEDPVRDEAVTVRNVLAAGRGPLGALVVLVVGVRRVLRRLEQERTHPWLVELTACTAPTRSAVWVVAGPDAAQRAVQEVRGAVATGRPPAPPGARLLDVRDGRSRPGAFGGARPQRMQAGGPFADQLARGRVRGGAPAAGRPPITPAGGCPASGAGRRRPRPGWSR